MIDFLTHLQGGLFQTTALYIVNMIVSFFVSMTKVYGKNGYKIVLIIDEL